MGNKVILIAPQANGQWKRISREINRPSIQVAGFGHKLRVHGKYIAIIASVTLYGNFGNFAVSVYSMGDNSPSNEWTAILFSTDRSKEEGVSLRYLYLYGDHYIFGQYTYNYFVPGNRSCR